MNQPADINDLPKKTRSRRAIPHDVEARWQRILDALSRIVGVRSVLITRVASGSNEVFLSNRDSKNSDPKGKFCDLNLSSHCEQVLRQRKRLLVLEPAGVVEAEHGSVIIPNRSYSLGYPLMWPDDEVFGTICICDRRDNPQSEHIENLLGTLCEVFEREILLIAEVEDRERLLAENSQHRSRLQKELAAQTNEILKSRSLIKELLRFEEMVWELSARLELEGEISTALDRIKGFFRADGCGLFEVAADRGRIVLLVSCGLASSPRPLFARLADGYPWAYQRLVEQREPVILSSRQNLPAEAAELAAREAWGTASLFLIPVGSRPHPSHVVGIWTEQVKRDWLVSFSNRLSLLGEIFVKALMHWQDQKTLLEINRRFAEAQRIAHVGNWEWDIVDGKLYWSDEIYRIFGLIPQEFDATYEAFLTLVHPEDREIVVQAVGESLGPTPARKYDMEHRVIRPDGSERFVHESGEVVFDADGKAARMIGTVLDITDRKRTEEARADALKEIKRFEEQLKAENIALRREIVSTEGFTDIIGQSEALRYVQFRVRQVAQAGITVLLTGETGTGKGLFAQALHEASDRKGRPFVHVNCAGLPSNLIESELFGREKGAFTGSSQRQIGRFEYANHGTIFLDEIGELPLDLQPKLLKVIETGEFERLGNPHSVKVDVRIVACTNQNLEEEVEKGRFRRDLFYRLNVFPITIPPLNKRKEDIPLLVKFYAEKFSRTCNKQISRVPEEIMKSLQDYEWPGNVRELINVVERAVIVSQGPALQLADRIGTVLVDDHENESLGVREERKGLADMERAHILRTLQGTEWKIEGTHGAAVVLELKPSTLRARMKKFGIDRPKTR